MSEHQELRTEPDQAHGELVVIGLIVTAIAIAVAVAVVRLLGHGALSGPHEAGGGRSGPTPIEAARVDELPTSPFEEQLAAERTRSAQLHALDTWSWADRGSRTVRAPVGVAAKLYVQAHGGGRR